MKKLILGLLFATSICFAQKRHITHSPFRDAPYVCITTKNRSLARYIDTSDLMYYRDSVKNLHVFVFEAFSPNNSDSGIVIKREYVYGLSIYVRQKLLVAYNAKGNPIEFNKNEFDWDDFSEITPNTLDKLESDLVLLLLKNKGIE
ncbi:MAG: hypothetical protein M0R17_01020 [Candidatus Omnitrophica bacterium]|jgi:hypothetical protein|nr:hypothetical protein [Candidatus Omnitrophota bacterium]